MILINSSGNNKINTILDMQSINTEVIEINFYNRAINNPYLMMTMTNIMENLIYNGNKILIILHYFDEALINMMDLDELEQRNMIRSFFNLIRGFIGSGHPIVIYRKDAVDLNPVYVDIDALPSTEVITDSVKLNKFIVEQL